MKTIKWIILCVVSIGIGSFIDVILEKIDINVWLSRGIGCLVAVMIALLLCYCFFRKKASK